MAARLLSRQDRRNKLPAYPFSSLKSLPFHLGSGYLCIMICHLKYEMGSTTWLVCSCTRLTKPVLVFMHFPCKSPSLLKNPNFLSHFASHYSDTTETSVNLMFCLSSLCLSYLHENMYYALTLSYTESPFVIFLRLFALNKD